MLVIASYDNSYCIYTLPLSLITESEYIIFQGDIIMLNQDELNNLMASSSRKKRGSDHGSGMVPPIQPESESDTIDPIWPNCVIPYDFDVLLRK